MRKNASSPSWFVFKDAEALNVLPRRQVKSAYLQDLSFLFFLLTGIVDDNKFLFLPAYKPTYLTVCSTMHSFFFIKLHFDDAANPQLHVPNATVGRSISPLIFLNLQFDRHATTFRPSSRDDVPLLMRSLHKFVGLCIMIGTLTTESCRWIVDVQAREVTGKLECHSPPRVGCAGLGAGNVLWIAFAKFVPLIVICPCAVRLTQY